MKKPFNYDERSDRVCKRPACERRLKKNVLARNPDADICYKCFAIERFARRNNLTDPDFNFLRRSA